jgi:hypothetical protein
LESIGCTTFISKCPAPHARSSSVEFPYRSESLVAKILGDDNHKPIPTRAHQLQELARLCNDKLMHGLE